MWNERETHKQTDRHQIHLMPVAIKGTDVNLIKFIYSSSHNGIVRKWCSSGRIRRIFKQLR